MVNVHMLIPRTDNSATKTIVVSTLVLAALGAVFFLNQVHELERNPIEEELEALFVFMPNYAFAEESTDYDSEVAIAQKKYSDEIIRAKAVFQQILEIKNVSHEERIQAREVYIQALLDAKTDYDKTLSEIKVKHDENSDPKTYYSNIKHIRDVYHKAISKVKITYKQALSETTNENKILDAQKTFNKAILDAQAVYEKALTQLEENN